MTLVKWPLVSDNVWGPEEIGAVQRVAASPRVTMGPEVKAFEKEFADWHELHMATMVNSGSSANLLAVAACTYADGRRGRWIVPALGWSTTYAPLHQYGHSMHVVDVDSTLNINALAVENILLEAERKGTIGEYRGIMVVNVLGNPAQMDYLRQIADKFGLWLIEDNCESLGAMIAGGYAGTWGDVGTFSFFWSHHITCGEGGMLLVKNPHLYATIQSMRSHGWTRGIPGLDDENMGRYASFRFRMPGYNLRPLDLTAAPGRIQLRKLRAQIALREKNLKDLHARLVGTKLMIPTLARGKISPMAAPFIYTGDDFQGYLQTLKREGIETRPLIAGNILRHRVAECYDLRREKTPLADRVDDFGFYVGIYGEAMDQDLFKKFADLSL